MSFPAPFLVHHSLPVVVMAVILVWAALVLVPRWRRTDPASMCLRSSAALFSSPPLATDLVVSRPQGPPEITTAAAATQPIPTPTCNPHARDRTHATNDTRHSHSTTSAFSFGSSSPDSTRTQSHRPRVRPNATGKAMSVFPWRSPPYSLALLPQHHRLRRPRRPRRRHLVRRRSGTPAAEHSAPGAVLGNDGGSGSGSGDSVFAQKGLSSSSSSSAAAAAATVWSRSGSGSGSPDGDGSAGGGRGSYSEQVLLVGVGGQF
ncbi:hypothetical protein L209DRAFT_768073 [Thermothelomyces heterothallicus CBS 203.75]